MNGVKRQDWAALSAVPVRRHGDLQARAHPRGVGARLGVRHAPRADLQAHAHPRGGGARLGVRHAGYAYPELPYEPKSLSVYDLYDWRSNPLWKGAAQHLDQLIDDNYAPFAFRCMESRLIPTNGPPRNSAIGVLQEWDPIQRELACCATDSQCDVRCPAAAPWYLKAYPIQYAQG